MTSRLASLALLALAVLPGTAAAQVGTGTLGGNYGNPTATVTYSAVAPTSNFGAPSPSASDVGYDIYQRADATNYYVLLQARPGRGGTSAGGFANLYFDLDPANGNGADLAFEITNRRAFVPGITGYAENLSYQFLSGMNFVEAAIPISFFTAPIDGLNYYAGQEFVSASNPAIVLRLSQAFGYSVAGGATYGNDRLGRTTLVTAAVVPEPATVALTAAGLLSLAATARRRRLQQAA